MSTGSEFGLRTHLQVLNPVSGAHKSAFSNMKDSGFKDPFQSGSSLEI
jgi:hypothetical protein